MFRFTYRPGGAWPRPDSAMPEPLGSEGDAKTPQEWADAHAAVIGNLFLALHPDGKDWGETADDKPPAPALADRWMWGVCDE